MLMKKLNLLSFKFKILLQTNKNIYFSILKLFVIASPTMNNTADWKADNHRLFPQREYIQHSDSL